MTDDGDLPRVLAVMPVRNERWHLPSALRDLAAAGADVVVLDNGSDDGSLEALPQESRARLLAVEPVPFDGVLDLQRLLDAAHAVADGSGYDWAVLVAADEWLRSDRAGQGLADLAADAEEEGATVLNFDEFVFVPGAGDDLRGADYRRLLLDYYFFEPAPARLMRMWRLGAGISAGLGAGHTLDGDVRLSARRPALRHYPVLGAEHAAAKYLPRRYPQAALDRGWHANRTGLDAGRLVPRQGRAMRRLAHWAAVDFDRTCPSAYHYWEEGWQ